MRRILSWLLFGWVVSSVHVHAANHGVLNERNHALRELDLRIATVEQASLVALRKDCTAELNLHASSASSKYDCYAVWLKGTEFGDLLIHTATFERDYQSLLDLVRTPGARITAKRLGVFHRETILEDYTENLGPFNFLHLLKSPRNLVRHAALEDKDSVLEIAAPTGRRVTIRPTVWSCTVDYCIAFNRVEFTD